MPEHLSEPPQPDRLAHDDFVATPLTPDLVDLDLEAYLASPRVISTHSDGRWPLEGFTREENLRLVTNHRDDHIARRAFTYVLLELGGERSLGCLYLNPLRTYLQRVGADEETLATYDERAAMVTFWVRQDREADLSGSVAAAVQEWLTTSWPLSTHLFRARPEERASIAALDTLPLRHLQLTLPGEPRAYRWYAAR